jgi:hypothetical protein
MGSKVSKRIIRIKLIVTDQYPENKKMRVNPIVIYSSPLREKYFEMTFIPIIKIMLMKIRLKTP